jgi:hypothetical protein
VTDAVGDHTVHVELFGALAARLGATSAFLPTRRDVRVGAEDRIEHVLSALGIGADEVSHLFLNGQYSAVTRPVRPGDRLGVFGRDMKLLYRQYFARETGREAPAGDAAVAQERDPSGRS